MSKKPGLNLDTEKVNDEFDIGGEKGRKKFDDSKF